MKDLFYGSHNTMTYLPIKNWWLFPGLLIARCQNKDYKTQFEQEFLIYAFIGIRMKIIGVLLMVLLTLK